MNADSIPQSADAPFRGSEQIARGLAARYGEDPISRFDLVKLASQSQGQLPLESDESDGWEAP